MKNFCKILAAFLCCILTASVLSSCSKDKDDDNDPGTNPGKDKDTTRQEESATIVGSWFTDISGKTAAKWNYGTTWQNTEFKEDGTGSTQIYYTYEDEVIGLEKFDFTYTTANGVVSMKSQDRGEYQTPWQVKGDELLVGDKYVQTYKKTTNDMATKFGSWSNAKDIIEVPKPSKYTVFVYGNAGGKMDNIIEFGLWERVQKYLTDHDNVRVVCMYKYGKDEVNEKQEHSFKGKYAEPGDIVWFELTDTTDLNKIKNEGMQAYGMGEEAKALKICNPNTLRMFFEFSSLACPAEDYVFAIWGHGSGFDPMKDVPGKYTINEATSTRGVMTDEWVDDEWMDMYELYDAMHAAGIDRFKTIMYHNCFMGNIESLTQAKDLADYIIASAHVLSSDGLLMTEFIRGLIETGDPVKAGELMFERSAPDWQRGYREEDTTDIRNGDYKMIRTDKFDAIVDAAKALCDRIMAIYPDQKEAIGRANTQVYRFENVPYAFSYPFFDIADYAHQLAKETEDSQMKTISDNLDKAMQEAFVHYRDVNSTAQNLDHYTLSVILMSKRFYTADYKAIMEPAPLSNFNEGYEKCRFHELTGWGNWLNMNEMPFEGNPVNGQGGEIEPNF